MKLIYCLFFILSAWIYPLSASPYASTANLPVVSNGRIAPLDSTAKIWLYEFYHRDSLKQQDLKAFNANDSSALSLYWNMHFSDINEWKEAPFFWVHYADVKKALELNLNEDRFSYKTLNHALYENQSSSLELLKELIVNEFAKVYLSQNSASKTNSKQKYELKDLSEGLFVNLNGSEITLLSAPVSSLWNFLKPGTIITTDIDNAINNLSKQKVDEFLRLFQSLKSFQDFFKKPLDSDPYVNMQKMLDAEKVAPNQIEVLLEEKFPLNNRLMRFVSQQNMLPLKRSAEIGTSYTSVNLHAFDLKIYNANSKTLEYSDNFTAFKDEDFYPLRESYFAMQSAVSNKAIAEIKKASEDFSKLYLIAYETLKNHPYRQAKGKALYYPSNTILKLESWLYSFPIIECAIVAYAIALILILLSFSKPKSNKLAFIFLFLGFIFQTATLVIRSYILQRPPVSNMFETVIYVPFVGMIIGGIIYTLTRSKIVLASGTFLSIALLVLLKITQLDMKLENVQAVLDSQYWLIVHVLMIVGSYGAFLVCGIMAHVYLLMKGQEKDNLSKAILHTMYIGVALLIPGTVLGGVWAAESWGRFWDWDPKESWAFITACIYVLIIHAYTFKYIKDFGLSIGAIAGMMAVSFTWYGVNYVLGTGLHTYGFGKGGEMYYFVYLGLETLFIAIALLTKNKTLSESS